jgi:hypothetical protein
MALTLVQGGMTQAPALATAQASTSGTSINFTDIPSWVKRITIMLNGVSTNSSSNVIVQLGDSGGIESTGYASTCIYAGGANEAGGATQTSGFLFVNSIGPANQIYGTMILNTFGNNTWLSTGTTAYSISSQTNYVMSFTGIKTLSATLDRVRITMANGTDTFDAGSINIMYEG